MFTLNEINAEIENWNSCDKFDLSTIESEDSSLLNTLLVNSIKYKSYKVLDHLIQKVSDLNYVDNDGNGFLHIIIQNLNLDNLEDFFIFDRVLYSGKIDLNQLNDKSETSFNLFLKKSKE